MRKLVIAATVAAVAAVVGLVLYQQRGVQEWLIGRALSVTIGAPQAESPAALQVAVCGSASPLGNDASRAQACLLVQTPEHVFLFDVGDRSAATIARLGAPMARLRGVFLTHLHSDHLSDLADVNLASWVAGRPDPLIVHGPIGTADVVAGFNNAYRLDRGYRVAHHGEGLLPAEVGALAAREHRPGVVWQDDRMTVTAVEVDHAPIKPAFGYRVDYLDRSVVISGDTVVVDSLVDLSAGADVVFHDALSRPLIDPMIEAANAAGLDRLVTIMTDVLDYHADSVRIEQAFAETDIGQLILYHLVPAPPNDLALRLFRQGLSDTTLTAHDGMRVVLPVGSDQILIDP